MQNIAPQELLTLWKKGKKLYPSLFEFTEFHLLKKYKDCKLNFDNKSNNLTENHSTSSSTIVEGLSEISKTYTLYSDIERACDHLKWDLLEKINSEKIIGLGYEAPIKSSDTPQIIPIHIWPQKINEVNWNDSSISINGIEFLNIRLIKSSLLKKSNSSPKKKTDISLPNTEIKDNPGGRPTIKHLIVKAYELLKTDGSIDFSKTLKPHTELIQETVRRLDSTIQGTKNISYKTIYSHLSKRFNTDKETFLNRL